MHGDICDTNIMVKTLNQGGFNDGSFLVVDYDSCGEMEQVRYPLNLNTTSVKDFCLYPNPSLFIHYVAKCLIGRDIKAIRCNLVCYLLRARMIMTSEPGCLRKWPYVLCPLTMKCKMQNYSTPSFISPPPPTKLLEWPFLSTSPNVLQNLSLKSVVNTLKGCSTSAAH